MRELIGTGTVASSVFMWGFAVVIAYLIISIPLYKYAYKRAKSNGMLARMF